MGRTTRAGREGRAVGLVAPQDVGLVRAIEEHTGAKMTELELDAEILVQVNTAVRGGPAAGRLTRGRKSSCKARTRRRRRRN